jgi:hypothetical protein
MSAGKGDSPRNCFSKKFKQHFDEIDWGRNNKKNKYGYEKYNGCFGYKKQTERVERP